MNRRYIRRGLAQVGTAHATRTEVGTAHATNNQVGTAHATNTEVGTAHATRTGAGRYARQGLTLLELMIVLIILVGLIAIVGPRLLGTQKKADVRTAQVQIGNLVSCLKAYAVDMKTFPLTEEGLQLLVSAPEDEALAKKWDGPYIEGGKLPIDPWGSEFQYEYGASETSSDKSGEKTTDAFPRIFSLGPDRQPGTSDDISNQAAEGAEEETGSTKGNGK